MASNPRLFIFGLLLCLALPAHATDKVTKDDLDAQKELLQVKIDGSRELVQKDMENLKTRIDAFDKRIDDQNNRVGDVGQSIDRFSIIVSVGGLLITALLTLGGFIGYLSVAKKAAEEAKSASQKWFDDNQSELATRILELENAAQKAYQVMDASVSDVKQRQQTATAAIEHMQKALNSFNEPAQATNIVEQARLISNAEQEALRQSVEQIKERPEVSYSFEDWNTRAFEALQSGRNEDAALYWKNASRIPNAGALNTAQALFNRAIALKKLTRLEEACATYERLIATYAPDENPAIRELVIRAMVNNGVVLRELQRPAEAMSIYDQAINAYKSDQSQAIRKQVGKAMFNKGPLLMGMKKPADAVTVHKEFIDFFATDNTPAIREMVAKAMCNIGIALRDMKNQEEAITTFEKMILTYSADTTPAIREPVARAMLYLGLLLNDKGKPSEAITAFEKLIVAYSSDSAPTIRDQVAAAIFNIGVVCTEMKNPEQSLVAYDKLITEYASDTTADIRAQVAGAFASKAIALKDLQKEEEAVKACQHMIATYSSDNTTAIRQLVVMTKINMAVLLQGMQKRAEAFSVYEEVISAYNEAPDAFIREQVAQAFNGKGFAHLIEAKEAWQDSKQASALLHKAHSDLLTSLELFPDSGVVLGNLAYVRFLLGDKNTAEDNFRYALSANSGGETLYRATLDDISQHTIQEDGAFRAMVERLWIEYQTADASK